MLTCENPNSKSFWKTSKQLLKIGKICQNDVPTLKLNDEFAETDLQKAEMLNKYFASQSYVNDDNKVLPQPTNVLHDPLYLFTITPQNKDVLDNLDASKSCGTDLMTPRLLKEGSSILATPYSILFNSSLQQGEFPSQWKEANVTCIHTKMTVPSPQITDPSHGKVIERCVHKELYNYINTLNL